MKQNNKEKSYQALETFHFDFYHLHKENIYFDNTDVSILDRIEDKM